VIAALVGLIVLMGNLAACRNMVIWVIGLKRLGKPANALALLTRGSIPAVGARVDGRSVLAGLRAGWCLTEPVYCEASRWYTQR
jgi:hypothetical protein